MSYNYTISRCLIRSKLGNLSLNGSSSASLVPPLLLPAEESSRTSSSSSSSSFHRRSSSGFSENHPHSLSHRQMAGDRLSDGREGEEPESRAGISKPFSLHSLGGISCLSLDPNLAHNATFDESFTD